MTHSLGWDPSTTNLMGIPKKISDFILSWIYVRTKPTDFVFITLKMIGVIMDLRDIFLLASIKSSLSGWLVDTLKVKVTLPDYVLDSRGIVRFSGFSSEDIGFYSRWTSLDENSLLLGVSDCWKAWPHMKRGKLGQIRWVCGFFSGISP